MDGPITSLAGQPLLRSEERLWGHTILKVVLDVQNLVLQSDSSTGKYHMIYSANTPKRILNMDVEIVARTLGNKQSKEEEREAI